MWLKDGSNTGILIPLTNLVCGNSKGQCEIYTCVDKFVNKSARYIKAQLRVVAIISVKVGQGVW